MKTERQIYFYALGKEVKAQEFIKSIPEPKGSQAIKEKSAWVLN